MGDIRVLRRKEDVVKQNKIMDVLRKEPVTCVSGILALASIFVVHPDSEYFGYIHWTTLSMLLSLMLITSGLKNIGVFKAIGRRMLHRATSPRSIVLILVGLCFFLAPFVTNDVALITFVPFAIYVLDMAGLKQYIIPTLALQTIAAHMGSSISPVGNPHNLYLHEMSGLTSGEFIRQMSPYFAFAGILLVVAVFVITAKAKKLSFLKTHLPNTKIKKKDKGKASMYIALFVICILAVMKILNCYAALGIVLMSVMFFDRKNYRNPDYCLLLTFAFLFVFVGNIGRIDAIQDFLAGIVKGREIITSIIASQVISNVPASILLPKFSNETMLICIGTDIGGIGTLIASMANLISFKQYTKLENSSIKRYILWFTVINVLFLIPLTAEAMLFQVIGTNF